MVRRYGVWAGNPKGLLEDTTRCVVVVMDDTGWHSRSYQCERKRGYGKDGLLCKQHARMQAEGKHLWIPDEESKAREKP